MKLKQELVRIKPREESGSQTSRKYDYQKNLSLFLLLKFHEKNEDYVFLFDYHDDLIILDSSIDPKNMDFYQIKSKDSGNWTVNALTQASQNKLSICGKLYLNKLNFKNTTRSLNFISNAKFSFKKLNTGDESLRKNHIKAYELEPTDLETFNNRIKDEHNLNEDTEFKDLANFKVTSLSNKDSSTHCLGELSKLINKLNPHNRINSELAYKQVFNEVSRRTENTVGEASISKLGELIEIKGITKMQFLGFLEQAGLYKSVEQEWEEIQSMLTIGGVGHLELLKFRKSWRDLTATLIKDSTSIPLENLHTKIEKELGKSLSQGKISDSSSLIEIVNYCGSKISHPLYDEYFIKCFIIKIINES